MDQWKIKHKEIIDDFLRSLNRDNDRYILKGGTSLMECYNMDRFSDNIDLNGILGQKEISGDDIIEKIAAYTEMNGFGYLVAKNTDTVKRCFIHYGGEKPLKIETSFRDQSVSRENVTRINGILVYKIDPLMMQKCLAYQQRDKIRDLYDVSFIFNNYRDELSPGTIELLKTVISYKGIEQFDYLVENQKDRSIDVDKLAEDFLNMYDDLGLLVEKEEKELMADMISEFSDSGGPVR